MDGKVNILLVDDKPDKLLALEAVLEDETAQARRHAATVRRRAAQSQKRAGASVAGHAEPSVDRMVQLITGTAGDLIGAHPAITLFVQEPAAHGQAPRTSSFTCFTDRYATWRTRRLQLDQIATTIVATGHTAARLTEAELRD